MKNNPLMEITAACAWYYLGNLTGDKCSTWFAAALLVKGMYGLCRNNENTRSTVPRFFEASGNEADENSEDDDFDAELDVFAPVG